jgi:hypothetical protein
MWCFFVLFCMGVELGLFHHGNDILWGAFEWRTLGCFWERKTVEQFLDQNVSKTNIRVGRREWWNFSWRVLFTQIVKLTTSKAGEMDEACSTQDRYEKYVQNIQRLTWRVKPTTRSRHVLDNIIKMDLGEVEWNGLKRIHVAQNKDQCCALMNR